VVVWPEFGTLPRWFRRRHSEWEVSFADGPTEEDIEKASIIWTSDQHDADEAELEEIQEERAWDLFHARLEAEEARMDSIVRRPCPRAIAP
jgi:hypothetical protein